MAQIAILERKCARCGLCAQSCPFGAIDLRDGLPTINEACRACGACVRACPQGAVLRLEARAQSVDKSQWRDILVFAEVSGGRLHPVALELIGKARELAAPLGYAVKVALIGSGMEPYARELQHYGPSEIAVYDDPALEGFRADVYAACLEDHIRAARPCVVLIGAGTYLMITKKETSSENSRKKGWSWFFYALGSAVFASLTSILGKVGIENIDSNLGTAIRTIVVLIMAWIVVFVTKKQDSVRTIDHRELGFICLSGLATGASWLCYYRALQDGLASVVVPIDKLSILVTILFSYLVFHEELGKKEAGGLVLIVAGTLGMLV